MEEDKKTRINRMKDQEQDVKHQEKGMEKSVQVLLDGSFLTRDRVIRLLPFLLFLTLLAVIYISNVFYGERIQRESMRTRQELKELRYEYITSKSDLMFKSKQSEVAKELQNTGIIESTTPPVKIIIKEKTKKD